MTRIVQISSVEETALWKNLRKRTGRDAQHLSANLLPVCEEASDRIKAFPTYAPQFTLHDERHFLRTSEIMALLLNSEISNLNVIELSLLILAAFFHDQGMVPSKEEFASLQKDEKFRLFCDEWKVEHPNYRQTVGQILSRYSSPNQKEELKKRVAELDSAMLTEYIRLSHGTRSANYVRSTFERDTGPGCTQRKAPAL